MPTAAQNEAMRVYAGIIDEAKTRISAIDTGLGSATALLSAPLLHEFCYLQLRIICELIALGCVVAHGDLTAGSAKKLLKEWAPEKIIKDLERLHPNFFPHAVIITQTPPTEKHPKGGIHLERKTEGFLTKAELISLHRKSGDALHRGTIAKLIKAKGGRPFNPPEIIAWRNKALALLNDHHIASTDNRRQLVCIFHDATRGGRVGVFLGEAPAGEPSPLDLASPTGL